MEEVVLKRCRGGVDNKHYLSILCRRHMSPKENISIPFYDAREDHIAVTGNSCRGLMYFDDSEGHILLCNLATKEFKSLSPSNEGPYTIFGCSGLGYDSKSGDYKVITNRYAHHEGGYKVKNEVYSLQSNSWKVIPGPGDINLEHDCGVYLGIEGSCYWSVRVDRSVDYTVLSFNFTSETFSRLPLPQAPEGKDNFVHKLFECDGFLGVVGFDSSERDYEGRVGKYFELWVRREGSWEKLFGVVLVGVGKFGIPLGLRYGRFMFLERTSRSSCRQSYLMVYDWVKEELREYDHIYDIPNRMHLLSYVENRVILPDAKPLKLNGVADPFEMSLKRCRCGRPKA